MGVGFADRNGPDLAPSTGAASHPVEVWLICLVHRGLVKDNNLRRIDIHIGRTTEKETMGACPNDGTVESLEDL
jgi:hypothetical protein